MSLVAIKVGGGLAAVPGALARVGRGIARAAVARAVVVIPGGGPFADAVREFDRVEGLSPGASHWMAVLAMDQFAHALADRIPGAVLTDEPGEIGSLAGRGSAVVLAPARWLRAADVLPHEWGVTSDSLAAWIAGALDAERLVLVKPVGGAAEELVDPYFGRTLPAGLAWACLGWEEIDRLEEVLRTAG
ncbi:MAG TPA: hypothetical protein VNK43_05765 [Gemmatimonadales bacterium]|nr:hypothetical protein [Gemmatimonadales bacterium]